MPVDKETEYATFPGDLPDFGTISTAPPLEHEAPAGAQPVTEGTFEAESKPKPKLPEFSPKHREPLDGLLYTGRLERYFTWAGHEFHIKTLTSGDRLKVGILSKPWVGTSEETRSWIIAQVAMAVLSVDRKEPATPLSTIESPEDARFHWAQQQFPWTIDAVFTHLLDLEREAEEVIAEMGKVSGSER